MDTLAKRLKYARKQKGYSQQELADMCKVSQQLISKIENEQIDSTNEIFSLADALSVTPRWLATGKDVLSSSPVIFDSAIAEFSREELRLVDAFRCLTSEQKNNTLKDVEEVKRQNDLVLRELRNVSNL